MSDRLRGRRSLWPVIVHNVKPECLDAYNSLTEQVLPKLHSDTDYPCDLVGNWNTWYGEQDQAVHLWRFTGGYPALMDSMNKLKQNQEREEQNATFPEESAAAGVQFLERASAPPGTMIEWGNNCLQGPAVARGNQECRLEEARMGRERLLYSAFGSEHGVSHHDPLEDLPAAVTSSPFPPGTEITKSLLDLFFHNPSPLLPNFPLFLG
ncbi:hypothetical protein JD844_015061 [Phrynosoma platyrhinos]|uniref:Uncharacterized protein n=1 Tax=Phrynosoma platyrhinos TaxID=52577 RepID=A0ABQ7T7U7_PHRPL|nr:hypothetical protein JD844_015061 [Phrynosoma platyrhinos]